MRLPGPTDRRTSCEHTCHKAASCKGASLVSHNPMLLEDAPWQDVIHDGPTVLFQVQRCSNDASTQLVVLYIMSCLHRGACGCGSRCQCCSTQWAFPTCFCACAFTKRCDTLLSHRNMVVCTMQLCAWTACNSGNLSHKHDANQCVSLPLTAWAPLRDFSTAPHTLGLHVIHCS